MVVFVGRWICGRRRLIDIVGHQPDVFGAHRGAIAAGGANHLAVLGPVFQHVVVVVIRRDVEPAAFRHLETLALRERSSRCGLGREVYPVARLGLRRFAGAAGGEAVTGGEGLVVGGHGVLHLALAAHLVAGAVGPVDEGEVGVVASFEMHDGALLILAGALLVYCRGVVGYGEAAGSHTLIVGGEGLVGIGRGVGKT